MLWRKWYLARKKVWFVFNKKLQYNIKPLRYNNITLYTVYSKELLSVHSDK